MAKESLFDAAYKGDDEVLSRLCEENPNLLNRNYLDDEHRNVLHISAILGHEKCVIEILQWKSSSTYHTCLARDRNGRNPAHLAAIHGRLNILKLVSRVEVCDGWFDALTEVADRGNNVLHLCVKYNQLEALKFLLPIFPEGIGAKNEDGMTIWHMAFYGNILQVKRRAELIRFLGQRTSNIVNIKNANDQTALDLFLQRANLSADDFKKSKSVETVILGIINVLHQSKALTAEAISKRQIADDCLEFLEKSKDAIMVVASLIATMAFQAMLNPPGGVWQDDSLDGPNPHRPGESMMAQTHPKYYRRLVVSSTVAFVSSLTTILMLLIRGRMPKDFIRYPTLVVVLLLIAMFMSVTAISVAYAISVAIIAPSVRGHLSAVKEIAIIVTMVWCFPLIFFFITNAKASKGAVAVEKELQEVLCSSEGPDSNNILGDGE
ncbi:OLC1v1019152C1 [Oldenlandia corymbosa var. corymbosa]|uniref:OLC1v1019152C1 n=1 Tax=Oldenlandia corymbosa var. corymbosa TaxID=529605 RepID=A0AAV1EDD1_OLDCO|nr:OLC1v1019152C1 [Oldenlandia corymbosa var. corymbosa]